MNRYVPGAIPLEKRTVNLAFAANQPLLKYDSVPVNSGCATCAHGAVDDGNPLSRKHGFAAELTASPPPLGNTFGSFASAAITSAGGLACPAAESFENADTASSANVPNVAVCGSPTPR